MGNLFDKLINRSWEEGLFKEAAKLGRSEGANGRPTADTPKYDVGETHIRSEVQKKLLKIEESLATELQKIIPAVTKKDGDLSQAVLNFQTRKKADELKQTFDGVLADSRTALEDAYFRKHQAEGHYNRFKLEHNITIDPDHPTDQLHYFSWIFVILAGETVMNAGYWGTFLKENYVAGILVALGLSVINIMVGFGGGIAFSYKNLSDSWNRVKGWGGLILALCVVACVNYLILAKRGTAVNFIGENSFDPIPPLIFCLGFVFALIAAYKGYRFFGSIPGYKAASTTFVAARNRIEQVEDELRQRISSEVRAQEDLRNNIQRTVNDIRVYYSKVKSDLKNLESNYKVTCQHLSTVLERVVGAYRSNNRATKNAMTPSPAWFEDQVERFPDETEQMSEALNILHSVSERADDTGARQHAAAGEEIAALQGVKTLYVGQELPKHLDACNKVGHQRFVQTLNAVGNQGLGERYA